MIDGLAHLRIYALRENCAELGFDGFDTFRRIRPKFRRIQSEWGFARLPTV